MSTPVGPVWRVWYEAARASGAGWVGWYHRGVPVDVPGVGRVVVRFPVAGPLVAADARRWPEPAVLAAVARYVRVPELLYHSTDPPFQVHRFVAGPLLGEVAPAGTAVPDHVVDQVVGLLAALAGVPGRVLPAGPPGWPSGVDTVGFAARMLDYAESWHAHFHAVGLGPLFGRLGIPADPFAPVAEPLSELAPRRLGLIHTDLHRGNVILDLDAAGRCVWLDWELACWGDPLYEVALHLEKTRYPLGQERELVGRWRAVMPPECTTGSEHDLGVYREFETIRGAVAFADRLGRLARERVYRAPEPWGVLVARLARRLTGAWPHWYGTRRVVTVGEVADTLAWWRGR